MEELRILHVITDLGKGGAERALIDMCNYMSAQPNIRLKIISLFPLNQYPEAFSKFDVEVVHFQTFSLRRKNENKAYERILKSFQPHIIHSHRFLGEFLTAYYVDPSIVYVTHGHDNMIQLQRPSLRTFFSKQLLLQAIERRFLIRKKYKKARTHFIANSPDTENCFKNSILEFSASIQLIPVGFDYNNFYQQPEEIKVNELIQLVNVGSFQVKKNQQFLVDVAFELKQLELPFELHLLGDGEMLDHVKEKVKQLHLTDHVHFHGIVNDVENWYKKADIYLHAAIYEPFGLVFLEAMAAGLPVVSLNGKGNAFIIEHETNGYIFDAQDPKLFAQHIQMLSNNKELYLRIAQMGQESSKHYDKSIQSQRLIDFYLDTLKK